VIHPKFESLLSPKLHLIQIKNKMEYKTNRTTDFVDLHTSFYKTIHTMSDMQFLEAQEQFYQYMSFNENKYDIITNWDHA